MAMTDRHFELFQTYLNVRMAELGQTEGPELFTLIKLDWDVLNDQPAMKRIVEHAELIQKRSLRDTEDVQRPILDARIVELEALEP